MAPTSKGNVNDHPFVCGKPKLLIWRRSQLSDNTGINSTVYCLYRDMVTIDLWQECSVSGTSSNIATATRASVRAQSRTGRVVQAISASPRFPFPLMERSARISALRSPTGFISHLSAARECHPA